MQADNRSQFKKNVLESRILVARLEIMLYALPDDFIVYVDDSEQLVAKSYKVTRSRRAYEYSDDSMRRYRRLVSPTEMYNIIKRHLDYERRRLEERDDTSRLVKIKDEKLTRLTVLLEQLRRPTGATILLELQPRYARRTDDKEELYEEAISLVARTQIADVTLIRDNLTIGHALAEMLMERLEGEGLVSRLDNNALKRTVLITVEDMQKREVKKYANK